VSDIFGSERNDGAAHVLESLCESPSNRKLDGREKEGDERKFLFISTEKLGKELRI
jgi:hypothetical protein